MTDEKNKILDDYLARTGQSMQDLMAGASQVGPSYIFDTLVPKAQKENKIIVWKDNDLGLGTGEYVLQDSL